MRYRKNYRSALTWSLVALLLIAALPFVLGIANDINENWAAQEIVAYSFDNKTAISAGTESTPGAVVAFVDTTQLFSAAQSVFYNANVSWNEFIVSTGATGADNTSAANRMYFNWNISAQELINSNVNKIVIQLKGLNANTNATYEIHLVAPQHGYHDAGYSINFLSISNLYKTGTAHVNNASELNITLNLDPATLAYMSSHIQNGYIDIKISSASTTNEIFNEGQTIYFQIYALKPHGGIVINGESFVNAVAEFYGVIFIVAAIFATGAVNPTHKHMFNGLYYGLKKYSKMRRKRKYERIRNKYYRAGRRYRW